MLLLINNPREDDNTGGNKKISLLIGAKTDLSIQTGVCIISNQEEIGKKFIKDQSTAGLMFQENQDFCKTNQEEIGKKFVKDQSTTGLMFFKLILSISSTSPLKSTETFMIKSTN